MQLDPNFARRLGAAFSRGRASLLCPRTPLAARRDAAKRALENAQKLEPDSPETLLALGYYQYWVLRDYGLRKPRSIASIRCYQAAARCKWPWADCPTRGTLG